MRISKSLQVPASTLHSRLAFSRAPKHTVTWRCVKLFWATRDSPISCKAQIVVDVCSVELQSHTVTWWCPRRELIMAHPL